MTEIKDVLPPNPQQRQAEAYYKKRIAELENANRRLDRELGKSSILIRTIEAACEAVPPYTGYHYKESKKSGSPVCAVIQLSDWHIGEVIRAAETEGFGRYNFAVAQERIFSIASGFIDYVENQRSLYDIEELAVLGIGDYVSGDIHRELSVTAEFPVPVQAAKAGWLLAEVVRRLAPHFKKVTVFEVGADNHGRLNPKPQAKQKAQNSFSYLVHFIANAVLSEHKNVVPVVAEGAKYLANIGNHPFLIEHGDSTRSWQGIPLYGIFREQGREAIRRMNTKKGFKYLACGHWHVDAFFHNIIINGSLSGTSEYDHLCGRHSEPCQVGYLVHPKHAVFNFCPFRPQ